MAADGIEIAPGTVIPEREIAVTFARSGGPGGQNVNKTNTRVRLRFNVLECAAIPEALRRQIVERLAHRLTRGGDIVVTSDRHRDQPRNRDEARARLQRLLAEAALPETPRKATRPSPAAKRRRVQEKRARSVVKDRRRKPPVEADG